MRQSTVHEVWTSWAEVGLPTYKYIYVEGPSPRDGCGSLSCVFILNICMWGYTESNVWSTKLPRKEICIFWSFTVANLASWLRDLFEVSWFRFIIWPSFFLNATCLIRPATKPVQPYDMKWKLQHHLSATVQHYVHAGTSYNISSVQVSNTNRDGASNSPQGGGISAMIWLRGKASQNTMEKHQAWLFS
jgi:hypothetical protein